MCWLQEKDKHGKSSKTPCGSSEAKFVKLISLNLPALQRKLCVLEEEEEQGEDKE